MDIWYKLGLFLLQGLLYVPLYALLFCHFLKYAKVTDRVWKRSFVLAALAYIMFTALNIGFGIVSAAWIGQVIGALVIAYVLTKLIIVPYRSALVAAFMIAIIGYDVPRLVFGLMNQKVLAFM